jgi:hypothetical protein
MRLMRAHMKDKEENKNKCFDMDEMRDKEAVLIIIHV